MSAFVFIDNVVTGLRPARGARAWLLALLTLLGTSAAFAQATNSIDSMTVSFAEAAVPRSSNSKRQRSPNPPGASDTHHSSSVPISVRIARRCTGTCPVFPSELFNTV